MRGLIAWLALLAASPAAAQAPALLPTPAAMRTTGAGFVLTPGSVVVARDAGERNAAARFAELMAVGGVRVATVRASATGTAVRFLRRPGMPAEGYRLETGPGGATITASDNAGLFYGAVTLWQLASAGADHRVAGVTIDDHPRFRWRGLMLDSARHMQSPEYVRNLIGWMAANKLNRLHWHLVDDQGWRLPVPAYPKLTSISAWRRGATAPGAPPLPLEGGFYRPEQIRDLVAYAADRGITIVPEIEMPGHALAAIRAYPELGMGVPIPPGAESDYGVFPWLYNTDEGTFRFLETVLTEVMRLFPSHDIHIGGDEATKEQWLASPKIQAQIKALGLKDEDALQGWFTARVGRFLAAHGRRLIGWDEILDGGVPADAAVTSWRGVDGAIKAARAGHDAVLSPAPTLYIDNRQGTGPAEPPGRGRLITLADILAFDPIPGSLSADEQRHILGLQANLWTEHVRTDQRAAWMMFPRAMAIAEIGWAPAAKRDVAGFSRQLLPQIDRLRPFGLKAATSAWAVTVALDTRDAVSALATLSTQSGLPIHYTLDGSAPGLASPLYGSAVSVRAGQQLRAASFIDDRRLPGAYTQQLDEAALLSRTSHELTLCSDGVALDLEDDYPAQGPRARFLLDVFNPCWRWDRAPVAVARSVAIDVGQIPFNFQVGADREKIHFRAPATPAGEFQVRSGGCDGKLIASLPLAPAANRPGVTRLTAPLPRSTGTAHLCFTYTARGVDPLWAIERVALLP
ncbi:family 20 glycosylhydrolase [Sphingomonas aerophila]|uniref:beta-N-acetylhexosaminidase n=1 Tax=Sphingomonas aerophila TaxID=1344948 RepID=A0A7W9BCP2_9SPHN|nr:family 20 glycosylhydrolase [Sphingomonas aerophila]MBB5714569.1 hexosaminidase [Sphingomonas aerophila]